MSASLLRIATFADSGRIDILNAEREIERLLQKNAQPVDESKFESEPSPPDWQAIKASIDPFDQVQLAYVIQVCRGAFTLSDAGRTLFAQSRQQKAMSNDADRLRKYLSKFGLSFAQVRSW